MAEKERKGKERKENKRKMEGKYTDNGRKMKGKGRKEER